MHVYNAWTVNTFYNNLFFTKKNAVCVDLSFGWKVDNHHVRKEDRANQEQGCIISRALAPGCSGPWHKVLPQQHLQCTFWWHTGSTADIEIFRVSLVRWDPWASWWTSVHLGKQNKKDRNKRTER